MFVQDLSPAPSLKMDDEETLLKQAFGDSSESEDDEQKLPIEDSVYGKRSHSIIYHNPSWEPIEEINGLWLCRDFLSPPQQSTLLSAIQKEGWFSDSSNNQAMRFGDLPCWAIELSNSIREVVLFGDQISESTDLVSRGSKSSSVLPSNLLWREPLFDQLIVNLYQPGDLCTC